MEVDLSTMERALGTVLNRSGLTDAALEMLEGLLLNSDRGVRREAKTTLECSSNTGAEVLPAVVDAEPAPIPNGRTAGHDEEASNSFRQTTSPPVAALGSGVRRAKRG